MIANSLIPSLLVLGITTLSTVGQTLLPAGEDLLPDRGSIPAMEDPAIYDDIETVPTIGPQAPTLAERQLLLDLYLKLENYGEADAAADTILRQYPRDPVAIAAKGTIALHRQDVIASLSWAEKLRSVQPGPQADLLLAGAYRLGRRFDEALAILERLRRQAPTGEPFAHQLEFGYTYFDARQYDLARRAFEQVRQDARYPAKLRDEASKQLANIARDRAVASAYRFIEMRELKKARAIADELLKQEKTAPPEKPDQNLLALAAVLDAEQHGMFNEAATAFEKLKAETPEGKPFAFNSAYATQLLDQRRYKEALAAATAADPQKNSYFTPEEVAQHRESLHFIRKFTNPIIESAVRLQDYSEGRAVRSSIIASKPLNKALTRIGLEYTFNNLDLEIPIPGSTEDSYQQAFLTARHQFSDHIHGAVALGSSNGNFAFRTSLGWSRPSQDQFLELTYAGGQQPSDTLSLEAIGASEDRLTLAFSTELPQNHRLRLKGNAHLRQIELENSGPSDLGDGWGARFDLEYLLYRKNRDVVNISAYAAVQKFNFGLSPTDIALLGFDPSSLVEDDYRAIGFMLYGEHAFSSDLSAHASVGSEYRYDSKSLVYSASGGLKYWLNDDTTLRLDALYSSSGQAGNEAAGYFEGILGVDLTL